MVINNSFLGQVYLFEIVFFAICLLALAACIVIAILFLKNRDELDERLYDLYEIDEDEARRVAERIPGFSGAIDEYKKGELIQFPERSKLWQTK